MRGHHGPAVFVEYEDLRMTRKLPPVLHLWAGDASGWAARRSPLGNVGRRMRAEAPRPVRFVHAPKLVCDRAFQSGGLRKHPPVGPPSYVQRSRIEARPKLPAHPG